MSDRLPPHLVGLVDQAAAADAEAIRIMHSLGPILESEPRPGPARGAATRRVVDSFDDRCRRGEMRSCTHLDARAPAVSYWMPSRPSRVRCLQCVVKTMRRMKGTREDGTCDACRAFAPGLMHTCMALKDPIVIAATATSLPPVLITFGLCEECYLSDQAAEEAER